MQYNLPIISQDKKLFILNPSVIEIKTGGLSNPFVAIYVDGEPVFTIRFDYSNLVNKTLSSSGIVDWMETANQKCFNIVTDYLAECRIKTDRASWFDFDCYTEEK